MKIKSTQFVWLLATLLIMGSSVLKGQPGEIWNITPAWNTGKDYRGIAYNPMNNHLYVAGTPGGSTNANTAASNIIRVLDASTGTELSQLDLEPLTVSENGYGINDVEVSMDGGIFATITTTNTFNPFKIYYWADENADPVKLWQSADDYDFGPGFSFYGDYSTEALMIVPIYDAAMVYYWEIVDGVVGDPTTLTLTGVTAGTATHVQALGTKITDGFWYSNSAQAPTLIDGTGNITGTIDGGLFTGATGDIKQFTFGSTTYLAVSNEGAIQTIDITGAAADFSDVTADDLVDLIAGTAAVAPGWPPEFGDGQEQAAIGNPDGSYSILSLSGGNYLKAVGTEGAPTANNVMVEGLTKVGETLTASYVYVDINGDAEGTSELKWYMADDESGTNKSEIASANGSLTYTVDAADEGKYISFSVLPVAGSGTASSAEHLVETAFMGPVLSNATAPVANDVTITGPIAVDETLTGSYTYFDENGDPEGDSEVKWYIADDATGTNAVEVATDVLTYLVQPADADKYVLFSVTPVAQTGVLLIGDNVTVASDSAVYFPELPPAASDLAITGREEVAGILTGSYTYTDLNGDEEGNTVINWWRADDAAGTNAALVATDVSTYTVDAADEGKHILFSVTPVTTEGESGDSVSVATGVIAPQPAPEAPEATDVTLHGAPETGAVLYGTYTYSDRTDDPEGESIHKWYTADDAAGTNQAEITEAAGSYVLIATEAMEGKHIGYEITPVATTGELLTGDSVQVFSENAVVASTNDGDFERVWMRADKVSALPEFMGTGSTERGFAIGEDHIYIASRNGGTNLVVADKSNGAYVSHMNTDGMDVGLFRINDVEVSADGQILACPLQINAMNEPFVVYKWTDELASPTKFIEFTAAEALRLGDKFTVVGDMSSGTGFVYAAASAGNKVIRWKVVDGIPDGGTVITLENTTSIGSTPAAYPFSVSEDANFIVDGRGFQAQIFDKDGLYVGALEGVGASNNQSNSPNIFYHKGRTMVAFHQKNDAGQWNIIVKDITGSNHITVGVSEVLSTANQELGGVHVESDADFFHLYMMSANYGLARFRGQLELPEVTYAESNDDGTKVNVWFSKDMADTGFNGTGWTINTSAGIDVDTLVNSDLGANVLTLELMGTIAEGDEPTLEYSGAGSVVAFDGMPLNAFADVEIVNIVGADAPVATEVTISGTERVGETFTATYTYSDDDGDLEGASEYQWYYASDAEGSDMLKILGENALTYTVTGAVEGKYIAFEVIPVAETGGLDFLVGEPAMSDWVRIIPVGIEHLTLDDVTAYPNPVRDILTLNNCGTVTDIQVVDIAGKQVAAFSTDRDQTVTIDMSGYNQGMYYLKLRGDEGSNAVIRIVKIQ